MTAEVIGFPQKQSDPPSSLMHRLLYWDRRLSMETGIPIGESDWTTAHNYITELEQKIKKLENQS